MFQELVVQRHPLAEFLTSLRHWCGRPCAVRRVCHLPGAANGGRDLGNAPRTLFLGHASHYKAQKGEVVTKAAVKLFNWEHFWYFFGTF
jgi:hypothetical protein